MVKTWRYSLPSIDGEGWTIAFLDSSGCCCILSDWGNVSYRWNSAGLPEGVSFREFLIDCGPDYLLNTFALGRKEYDPERTLLGAKRSLLSARYLTSISKDQARQEWELLEDKNWLETEYDFWDWCRETLDSGPHELHCQRPISEARAFVERGWPRLQAAIRKDWETDNDKT